MNQQVKTTLWAFYSLGGSMVVSLTFFVLGGLWLDKKISTFPVFLLIGIIICLYVIVLEVKVILKKFKENQ